jgi:hypothetical protein
VRATIGNYRWDFTCAATNGLLRKFPYAVFGVRTVLPVFYESLDRLQYMDYLTAQFRNRGSAFAGIPAAAAGTAGYTVSWVYYPILLMLGLSLTGLYLGSISYLTVGKPEEFRPVNAGKVNTTSGLF